jgi:hypothetical protein
MAANIDHDTLTAEQRMATIARILAGALLRLRDRALLSGPQPQGQNLEDSAPNCLEVSRPPRLSVHPS